ncbi:outer membrane lipoprotein-sorting protein [Maribacter sp. M208]|uniref:outer membrane lipoprotein-sorting protein n=1 Tax=Maribacter huludaoensis TaxID=3030010 RepID=UPI0023EDDF38|nr:outer membrane lipoprotein-sorting protein [Maribacter huludaoensis]MDF4221068.1 outer membrane lipoprotein-sorting protein [Maribacter huludaoensis]
MKNIMKYFFNLLLTLVLTFGYSQEEKINYLELMDKCLYIEYANLRMDIYKKDKVVKFYDMISYRVGEKMRLEFVEPATERGRKMLNDESNLWMYLPRTSRVMRLPLKQSFMGSDASNRDLMRMSYQRDYDIIKIEETTEEVILILKAKDLTVSYNKVVLRINKDKMSPVKQEMFSLSNKLLKTIVYENHIVLDDIGFPTTYTIVDNLLNDSKTIMQYSNAKRKNNIAKEFFTLGSIRR